MTMSDNYYYTIEKRWNPQRKVKGPFKYYVIHLGGEGGMPNDDRVMTGGEGVSSNDDMMTPEG